MHIYICFPGGSVGKEPACSEEDLGLIPGLGRSPGRGNLFRYSCLENPHGQKSLEGYSPWGHKELGTTGRLSTHTHIPIYINPHPANRNDYLARLVLKIKEKLYTHTHTHTHTHKIALPGNHFYWTDKHIKTKKGEEMTCLWLQCFFFLINLHWSIVDSQCHASVCYIAK